VTTEQVQGLEASIKATIREWQWGHGLKMTPYYMTETRNEERIDIPHTEDSEV